MTPVDTGTPYVTCTIDQRGVALVTLDRQERLNALGLEMVRGLSQLLPALELDDGVGAVVLTGAGRAFSAGGDIGTLGSAVTAKVSDQARVAQQLSNQRAITGRLAGMPKPTLAAIPGVAAGMGVGLALACDLRYGSPQATFVTSFAKVGLPGDYGTAWLLTRALGPSRATELMMLSPKVDAERLLALGLLHGTLPADQLLAEVLVTAGRLATGPRLALGMMKASVRRALDLGLDDFMKHEVADHVRALSTDDHREAAAAFTEKRPPVFRGR